MLSEIVSPKHISFIPCKGRVDNDIFIILWGKSDVIYKIDL